MSDYTIDWSHTNVDGNNTIAGPDGNINVSIATPQNGEGKQWFVENGMLKNWDVTHDSSADITFSEEVENVNFTLLDVDRLDEITIMTKDADGNAVEVEFEATGVHDVNGNVVTGTQTNAPGPGADNSVQDINIHIPGPVMTFWIVLDDGPERSYSGTVAVSDIHFDVASTEDGYVDGTAGDDEIIVNEYEDADGDEIDDNDAILPGEGAQDDIVLAGAGDDLVMAKDGDDEIYGGNGDDTLCGQDGDDVVYGGRGNDILEGMNNNDVLLGEQGNDTLYGDAGEDIMSGGTGHDEIFGGAGDDLASGGKGNDAINMGNGNDVAYGGLGADSIIGGAGNDTLIGGNQSFNGTQDFNDLAAGELVDGQYIGEGVTITSGDPKTPVMAFDTANPTGGDDDLATNNLGKVLILSEDRDGSDPDDNASGGSFFINFENPASVTALTLLDADGGAWVKYYDMNGNLLQQVDVTTADNGQHVVNTNLDNVAQIEVILGNSGAIDNLTYSIDPDNMDGNDVIAGGDGEDYIEGNAGNDSIDGGNDDDEIYGGDGNDRIFGNDGDDVAFGGAGDDNMGGADNGNDEYYGGAGNDMFETSFGDDTLYGGEGNDNLWASSDNDTVFGGTGDDSAFGGHGDDIVYGDEGNDTVSGGSGSDSVFGGAGDDIVEGGGNFKDDNGVDGPDALFGGDGSDTIIGGAGDVVDGGATGSDYDVLDLTGQGSFVLENVVSDTTTGGNGNGFNGTVVFVDGDGNPTGETLTFTDIEEIIGDEVNRGPDAADDVATVDEDGSVIINVLGNDSDPDGDPLEVTDATSPNGTVTINADGTLTFEPADDFNGNTTITYTIDDGQGGTDTATVNVTVNPVNDGPVANDDVAETDEDTAVIIDVLGNDTDVDGDDLTVTDATSPNGDVTINGDGTITFEPAPDFSGETTITYTIDDGNGGTDTATVTVTVGEVNDGPDAVDDANTTDEDTSVTVDLLANDTDPEGDDLEVISATLISGEGTITDNGDGTVTFEPAEDFNGEAVIEYTISDGNGGEDTAQHTITVDAVNDAPDAVDDASVTDEDTAVIVDLLANDTDVDGDDLTVVEATVPAEQGTLVDNGDGTVTFTPADNFTGEATISYTIEDEDGLTDSAVHTIDVAAVQDAPEAEDDVAETDEDTPVTIDVLDNDSDPDGDPLEVTEATSPDGDVTINADGTITFDPAENFNGDTTITYTVEDPDGNSDTATVTVTVNPVNDAPEANDDADVTDFNSPVIIDLLDNDTDVDGDDLSVTAVSVPVEQGTIVNNNDGTATFTPAMGFTGVATVSYTIADEEGLTDDAEHTITVGDAPLDGTVEGTAGDDIIDGGYLGDPDGDRVDNDDAILPGDVEDDDLIYGFGGDDTILAGQGDDEVFGGDGNDVILGQDGNDTLSGDAGEDNITGGKDNDTIFGGDDNDTLDGDSGDDSIQGNEGDDSILGGGGDDIIRGGDGDDVIDGENNDDMIFGGAGDDDLSGGTGVDKIEGGSGDDTIDGGAGDDDLWGASGDDTVFGGTGNDTIATAEGSDVVEGGDGNDTIDTSNDQVPLPDLSFGDIIPADGDFPGSSPTDDLDTVFGGAGNDTITTGDDADVIFGGTGRDVIDGGIDADEIDGGDGNDTIIGGEGSDTIFGGEGNDTIFAGLEPGTDLFGIPEQFDDDLGDPEPDNGDDLVFGGAGNDTILGADDSDELYGDDGDDFIDGEIDDDELFGGAGNDTLLGGEGDDILKGEEGDDILDGEEGDDVLFGGVGEDTLDGGDGDDRLAGGQDDDVVNGGDGDDTVSGNDGNDTLTGGDGEDFINGGADRDVILGGNGGDVVNGGNAGDDFDTLDLTGAGVDFITYTSADREDGIVNFLDGTTMTFEEIENVVPCFTPGTTIATPKGERLVEELREGDRIITRDNGIQEIRWTGRKEMTGKALVANPHLKPILVRAGALGNGLPERDMLVSPNHRMLVASDKTQLYFEEREVLAAAKHLVGSEGIHAVDVMGTAYIHFMFDNHEVVLSNGAWTESFQPGDYSLKGIGNAQRNEIFELFPELQEKQGLEGYQSARRALKKHEAKLLVK
ncbi:cadherin-like domain-containing protein [Octadecabacter sp. G9-8]|uniref:Cadherin-like domain-containing protein n=1 Tax=Octadecabacter dasysiphoniae TaxID=2909341 RepID=A0ABS9CUK0_9RHOB|nr:cadherin-like domain-containing protein [Octadecabacter dasysiphoniae]MCF2870611.1 cadherin-like domain-containing protein [Octadecabacter dasysiphoniae]